MSCPAASPIVQYDHPAAPTLPASTLKFSVDDVGFFEGAEKLLEIRFEFPDANSKCLRDIPKHYWEKILNIAECHILSECSNKEMDAYLLSESSMYVSSDRFILKTCGSTRLLNAINPVLDMVKEHCPSSVFRDLFYSHCKFIKPDLQVHPHTNFADESSYLDSIFSNGAAYILGRINGKCWYLYLVENLDKPLDYPDQTLEILMTNVDAEVLGKFSKAAFDSADDLTEAFGIDELFPGAILDSYLFDPCGYSLNAIIKGDVYFTIHVTPQEECSYVSFETNLVDKSYNHLVQRLVDIFKPGDFTVTVFANKVAECGLSYAAIKDINIDKYKQQEQQILMFKLYNLTFMQFKLL